MQLGEHESKWDAERDLADLSVLPKREYVGIQVLFFAEFFDSVAEPDDDSAVVVLDLAISLRVVRCCEDVLDSQDLGDVLKTLRAELLAITRQERARAIGHTRMSEKRFCNTVSCDSSPRNRTNELWKMVWYNQCTLVAPWSGYEFPQDVIGNETPVE